MIGVIGAAIGIVIGFIIGAIIGAMLPESYVMINDTPYEQGNVVIALCWFGGLVVGLILAIRREL